jgi:ion channel-forming bestrophin family protein
VLLNKRIPVLYLLEKVRTELIVISLLSTFICFIDQKYLSFSVPISAITILGTLISLLLAFRTAQAYDRWWEARKIWGRVLSESRSLVREAQCFFKGDSNLEVEALAKRQIAWNYELGDTLRGKKHFDELEEYLSSEEFLYVSKHMNSPNAILDMHSKQIRKAYENGLINEFQQIHLMNTVSDLCDLMGMSERIKSTVFPKTYSTLLHLSIYFFALLLPFGLEGFSIRIEILISIVLSISFFLIERTAVYLQDPFEDRPTDVSVTAIARVIEINILEMIQETNIPDLLDCKGFYIK